MLILLRHGQTVANAEGRLLGRLDPPLTDLGRRQARALRAAIGSRVGRVVVSPLARARETAAALGVPGVDIEVDERWIEIDYGPYDGQLLSEVPASLWDGWRRDPAYRPPGGESLAAVGSRVREACEELVADARDGDVVVVSHVSPIKAAVAWALGVGDEVAWRTRLDVAAACRITIGPRGPALWGFNLTGHLLGLGEAPVPENGRGEGEGEGADLTHLAAVVAGTRERWEQGVAAVAAGAVTLAAAAADPGLAGIKAVKIVEVLPGVGKVRARRGMAAAGIDERARLGRIGGAALARLEAVLEPAAEGRGAGL